MLSVADRVGDLARVGRVRELGAKTIYYVNAPH